MSEERSSYRQIMKATSIFGGVQIFSIIVSIVRSKIIAVYLGSTGMGITGLFTSATSLIQGFTSMGLSSSAVKFISEANSSNDSKRFNIILGVFKRLVWITGALGMLVTILSAPWLSKFSFGNYDYTIPFIFLSITLLFQQLISSLNVLLQSTRRIKDLALVGLFGSIGGLIFTLPIYYYFGVEGIVATLIVNSLVTLIVAILFSRKIKLNDSNPSVKEVFKEGNEMLKMGIAMSLNSVLVMGSSYLLRSYIRLEGGLEAVGLYSAGFTIINTYVGLVFSAMTTDYYPRLAAVNEDKVKCNNIVNQQAEIAILIIAPLLSFFLVFMPDIISLLYSDEFIKTNGFLKWAALGMLFKTASWAIAYLLIAKGKSKVFMLNELISNVYMLVLNILGFKFFGLDGLGISFLISFFIYFIQILFLTISLYGFKLNFSFIKLGLACFLLILITFLNSTFFTDYTYYIIGIINIGIITFFSFFEIGKRIDLKSYFT